MITVKTENYNLISQDFYNKTIDSLDLNLIPCNCGHSGCLIRHGSYKRSVQLADRVLSISVVRVYCKACGHINEVWCGNSSVGPRLTAPYSEERRRAAREAAKANASNLMRSVI